MKIKKIIVYILKEKRGEKIKDTIIGYITKKDDEIIFEESDEIKDNQLRKRYLEELNNYIQSLIKNEEVMIEWCEEAKKNDKSIHHQYARVCPVNDQEFLEALYDAILKRKDKILGKELSVDVVLE